MMNDEIVDLLALMAFTLVMVYMLIKVIKDATKL